MQEKLERKTEPYVGEIEYYVTDAVQQLLEKRPEKPLEWIAE